MNRSEAMQFIVHLGDAFAEVRKRTEVSGRNDRDLEERKATVTRLLELWVEALADVDLENANRCLSRMVRGDVETPTYASEWDKIIATIRKWCRNNRLPKLTTDVVCQDDERKFHCLDCLDSGTVVVINPELANSFRSYFAKLEPTYKGDGYATESFASSCQEAMARARRWCKENKAGPITAAVNCYCDAAAARRHKYTEETNETAIQYRPTRMPIANGFSPIDLVLSLKDFAESTKDTDQLAWQP